MQVVSAHYHELALAASGEVAEIWIAKLAEAGFDSFLEEEELLKAYVPSPMADSEAVVGLIDEANAEPSLKATWQAIVPQNWNQTWESNFEPVLLPGQLQIRASHHAPDPSAPLQILIDPKMSFGTGHHATTRQMAAFQLNIDHQGQVVVDAGCGTGILAILAEKLGARKVFAFDHEEWAAANSIENVALNGCHAIDVQQADLDSYVLPEQADGVLANITRNLVIEHLPRFATWLKPGGWLLTSGYYIEDLEAVRAAAEATQLAYVSHTVQDRWCAASFARLKE